jgi:hypothetical protein
LTTQLKIEIFVYFCNRKSAANFNKAQSSLIMVYFNNSYKNQITINVQEKNQRATGGLAQWR